MLLPLQHITCKKMPCDHNQIYVTFLSYYRANISLILHSKHKAKNAMVIKMPRQKWKRISMADCRFSDWLTCAIFHELNRGKSRYGVHIVIDMVCTKRCHGFHWTNFHGDICLITMVHTSYCSHKNECSHLCIEKQTKKHHQFCTNRWCMNKK